MDYITEQFIVLLQNFFEKENKNNINNFKLQGLISLFRSDISKKKKYCPHNVYEDF